MLFKNRFEYIYDDCIKYLSYLTKCNNVNEYDYESIIKILKSDNNINMHIYFQEKYIDYLKSVSSSTFYKELLSKQVYLLKVLNNENLDKSTKEYIKVEFDAFAKDFENQLVDTLGYNIPALLANHIKDLIDVDRKYNILDLGCGTGLLGVELQDISNNIVGIDLSYKMLEIT